MSPGLCRTSQQLLQGASAVQKTYDDVACTKSSESDSFPSASLPNGNLSEPLDQGGREMIAGRRQGMLGRLVDRGSSQARLFETLLSYFCNPVSDFPLTYHSEFIDEEFSTIQHLGGRGLLLILPPLRFYTKSKPYYTALHMTR